jgi:hypothetical protein
MTIFSQDDIIQTSDVRERVSEMELEASSRYADEHPEGVSWGELVSLDHAAYLDDEDGRELASLRTLLHEVEQLTDEDDETLISDAYFEDYARQLAEDVCEMPRDMGWPYRHIDWESAANALKIDYSSLEFEGVTYWLRG